MSTVIEYIKRKLAKFRAGKVIERIDTDLNPGLEVLQQGDLMILNSANANYSFGGLHSVFRKAFALIKIDKRNIDDVLVLGFGAGSVASILLEELKIDCSILGVEKDPEVIRIGRKYFNTDRYAKMEIVEADAAAFIETEKSRYDLIIIDVYVDIHVPESCETMEFLNAVESCLKPGGMALFNKMIYNRESGIQAKELERKFNTLAGELRILKIRENVVNKVFVYEKVTSNQ